MHDERVVMTLDAGGTNFLFSAIRGFKEITTPILKKAVTDDLPRCLSVLVEGFQEVKNNLSVEPVAISFAFPGPADYQNGVIGDLPNFPAFRGGVPLAAFLEEHFGILSSSTTTATSLRMVRLWQARSRRSTASWRGCRTPRDTTI